MANREHLDLIAKGLDGWNAWRVDHPEARGDLSWADLAGASLARAILERTDLRNADLREADLNRADLSGAQLERADLSRARLARADLRGVRAARVRLDGADLSRANLAGADLRGASLRKAKLDGVDLSGARLAGTNLSEADLSRARLVGTDLEEALCGGALMYRADLRDARMRGTDLRDVDLERAVLGGTVFADADLRGARRLDQCEHRGPSFFDPMAVAGAGELPEAFLRGCGWSADLIEAVGAVARRADAVSRLAVFIAHEAQDRAAAERLRDALAARGVRVWLAPEGGAETADEDREGTPPPPARHLEDFVLAVRAAHPPRDKWLGALVEDARRREHRSAHASLLGFVVFGGEPSPPPGATAREIRERTIATISKADDPAAFEDFIERILDALRSAAADSGGL